MYQTSGRRPTGRSREPRRDSNGPALRPVSTPTVLPTAESLAEEDEEADSVATGLDTSRFADAGVVRSRPRKNSHLTAENLEKNYAQEYVPRPEKTAATTAVVLRP
ncbi:hypothetical protein HYQ46_002393 [Verticillium longisporum]|nr:hypothetical protein HYQ46_002393 [Verticillium longisporum]